MTIAHYEATFRGDPIAEPCDCGLSYRFHRPGCPNTPSTMATTSLNGSTCSHCGERVHEDDEYQRRHGFRTYVHSNTRERACNNSTVTI